MYLDFSIFGLEYKSSKNKMNSFKTFDLLIALDKKETILFRKQLLLNKRQSLTTLFDLSLKLVKQNNNIDFKDFFELFYKKKYTSKEDNTFRNELRLLNGLLENHIVSIQIEKQVKNDFYLKKRFFFEYLLEQESFDLLEKELAKVFKQIEANNDYVFFYDFFSIWTRFQNKNIKIELKYLEELKNNYVIYFQNWLVEIGIKTKKMEVFIAFIDRFSFMVDRNLVFDENITSISFEELNQNNYFSYLQNKTKSFKIQGDEKSELLHNMLLQLDLIKTTDINIDHERFAILQSLGVEKMLQAKNLEAVKLFSDSLLQSGKIDDKVLIKGIYNYLSTLVKLEDYKSAIALFEEHQTKILKSNIIDLFYCIITMSYIFINDIEKAEQINKIIDSNNSVGNFLYSRCNLAIIHFLNNESELCLNELTNISQSIKYHKNQDKAYQDFVSFFRAYIQVSYSKTLLQSNQNKLQEIVKKLNENFVKSDVSYGADSLHLVWLLKQISTSISS